MYFSKCITTYFGVSIGFQIFTFRKHTQGHYTFQLKNSEMWQNAWFENLPNRQIKCQQLEVLYIREKLNI